MMKLSEFSLKYPTSLQTLKEFSWRKRKLGVCLTFVSKLANKTGGVTAGPPRHCSEASPRGLPSLAASGHRTPSTLAHGSRGHHPRDKWKSHCLLWSYLESHTSPSQHSIDEENLKGPPRCRGMKHTPPLWRRVRVTLSDEHMGRDAERRGLWKLHFSQRSSAAAWSRNRKGARADAAVSPQPCLFFVVTQTIQTLKQKVEILLYPATQRKPPWTIWYASSQILFWSIYKYAQKS